MYNKLIGRLLSLVPLTLNKLNHNLELSLFAQHRFKMHDIEPLTLVSGQCKIFSYVFFACSKNDIIPG